MSEQEQRQVVVKALRSLDAHSVENRVGIGTPDINYLYGWIETKRTKAWPKRASTLITLDHELTQEQRIWLERRWSAGGEAYVLLQIGREWLLFDAPHAHRLMGVATQEELRGAAMRVWPGNKDLQLELAAWLCECAKSRRDSNSLLIDVGRA